jgi:phosphate-selective porin
MKKVLSTIVAAIVALSFSAVVFASDVAPAPAATPIATASPALEKKATPRAKRPRTMKKGKFTNAVKKEAAPAPAAK